MVLNDAQRAYALERFIKPHDRESGYRTIRLDENASLKIWVERGVLGSDLMKPAISLARFLHKHAELYEDKKVLDMGCGAGPQGIVCAMNGAGHVDFSDISSKAVSNCRRNLKELGISNSGVYEGDLFGSLPETEYDVILFNNPFFPGRAEDFEGHFLKDIPWQGFFGGTELLKRFYSGSKEYMKKEGIIIQPYPQVAGEENNPANRAPEHGFRVEGHEAGSIEDKIQIGPQSIYILSRLD